MITNRDDPLKTDLQLDFADDGGVDLQWTGGEVDTVSGVKNLTQALTLRLLVYKREIAGIGHPTYGSRVREMIGEPLTRENLELLRRHVRQALRADARVTEVVSLTVTARRDVPGAVDVAAKIRAITDEEVELAVALDLR